VPELAAAVAEVLAALALSVRYTLLLGWGTRALTLYYRLPRPPASPYMAWVKSQRPGTALAVLLLELVVLAAGFALVAARGEGLLLAYVAAVEAVSFLAVERGARKARAVKALP
jgi:hypothetical protein